MEQGSSEMPINRMFPAMALFKPAQSEAWVYSKTLEFGLSILPMGKHTFIEQTQKHHYA